MTSPDRALPRYPVYIPSKGRAESCLTARFLDDDGVSFYLVVEPQEHDAYVARFGHDRVLTLPFSNRGSVIPARNWIKDHATAAGHHRHWQLDDNIHRVYRKCRGKSLRCPSGPALRALEDFADRYDNMAIVGMNYLAFVRPGAKVMVLNCHVYSCCLILNGLSQRWRGRYNEDTDYCLQVLSDGWCTALVNAFIVDKVTTMKVKGGNTDVLYKGDGRLKMARSLERLWPGVVTTKRRFKRPQHVVKDAWRRFDTPLKLKPGIDLSAAEPNEYGMELRAVKEVKSEALRQLVGEWQAGHG